MFEQKTCFFDKNAHGSQRDENHKTGRNLWSRQDDSGDFDDKV